MRVAAILFDFDGVLIESEASGNRHIAEYLTGIGHPTTPADALANFMGHAGAEFEARVAAWIGRPLPEDFVTVRRAENERVLAEGVDAVEGAIAFVRALPPELPKAVVSSSRVRWIRRHLEHIGLLDAFGNHLYSGQEHVARPKPAPDLYRYAAEQLGVRIEDCAILEDSPVGATGAVASGGYVVGLCAGTHCTAGHDARLREIGVQATASGFDEVRELLGLG